MGQLCAHRQPLRRRWRWTRGDRVLQRLSRRGRHPARGRKTWRRGLGQVRGHRGARPPPPQPPTKTPPHPPGLACLIADNYAVEIIPTSFTRPAPHALMPLHEHCIFKNGIHLGELWYLTELARWLRAPRRNRFLLPAPPLRLPGAVGSPATPVATV